METKKITALVFILPFVLLALVFGSLVFRTPQVKADTASSSASVTNVVPVASIVSVDTAAASVTLTENTTTTVTVTATVTDNNGCEDIDSVSVKFYKTTTGAEAADDENNHYTVTASEDGGSCTAGGSDLTATFTATIPVYYYADPTDITSVDSPTDWTALVTPSDEASGTTDTDTIEMDTLTALDVTAAIAYGELALGADTGTGDDTTTVTNTGNEGIDVDVDGYGASDGDGYSMTCTWGTIPVANEKYATAASTAYASKTALSDTATEVDMDIAQRTTTVTTGDLYWGFGMPTDGVGGSCTGTVVFTANSDSTLD
ncbi:hypothetical protein AMJ47_01580 [Parcubacteria bacterium DG_72]|nr:MAG: hypothetical protein AMJ47_01580 [Parcubacteria bacterium DG_72]